MKSVISLTTIPNRVDQVHHIIDMLLKQSYKPDLICLYVSFDEIPEKLRDLSRQNSVFKIKKVKDLGPGTKWYYSLKDNYDIVVFLDDDVFIHNNLIEELIEYHTKYSSDNLGFIGTIKNSFVHNEYLENCDKYNVELLGGYRGVLIPWHRYTSYQKESLLSSFERLCESSIVLDDDYFLSKVWKHIGINSSVVKSKNPWAFQFAIWSAIDNLNNEKNEEKMKTDRRRIDTYFSTNCDLQS
jgi:hypothetical protein